CSDASVGYNLQVTNLDILGNSQPSSFSWVAASNGSVGGESTTPQVGSTITDILNNVTTSNQTVVYTVTPTGINGCIGNPFVVTITVQPEPVGANATMTICSDGNVNYDLQVANINTLGNSLASTFSWVAASNTNVTGESTAPQAGGTINDVLNNVTNSDQIVVYTVTPTSTGPGCIGNPFTVSVTVRPEPVGGADVASVCSDVALTYNLQNNVTSLGNGLPASFSWVAASNLNVGGESIAPVAGGTINDVLNNVTGSDQVVVYTITPTSTFGCLGNPFVVSITVRSEPVGAADTKTICSDESVNYNLQTNVTSLGNGQNANFTWVATSNANVTGESTAAQVGATITDILNNVTNLDQVVTYTVMPTGANGCPGNPFTINITVQPEPVGMNDTKTICGNLNVNYDLQNNINVLGNGLSSSFSWVATANPNVSGESTTSQVGSLINDLLVNVTNADQNVVYTATPAGINGCDGNLFTITVTVRPQPIGVNDTKTVCSDISVAYDLQNNINVLGNALPSSFSWVAASNGNVTGESTSPVVGPIITDVINNVTGADEAVVYTVTPTSTLGCIGAPFTVSITVRSEPVGVADAITICSDVNVSYSLQNNINTLGNGIVSGFSWVATPNANVTGESTSAQATGTINDVVTNVTNVDQQVIYTVTPTGINGCIGNPFLITVTVRPEPVGVNDTKTICSDAIVNYNLTSNVNTLGNNLASTFSWVATANTNVTGESTLPQVGSIITDALNNVSGIDQTVVYTITPTSNDGCVGNTFTVSITIQSEPVGLADVKAVCSDAPVNYALQTNVNTLGNNVVSTFSWIAAANANVTGESSTAQAGGTITDVLNNVTGADEIVVYTVTPTSSTGCAGNPFVVTVTVRPEPVGGSDTKTICSDATVNYDLTNNVATLGNNLGANFNWVAAANGSVSGESLTSQAGAIITDLLNNVSGVDQVVVYTITPTGINGCVGNPFTVSVTVQSEPIGLADGVSICSDQNVAYDLQNNVNTLGNNVTSTFSWQAAANPSVTGESTTPQAGGIISDILSNTSGVSQVVDYTVTPTGTNGCPGNPFLVSVTVRSEPLGVNDAKSICSDDNVNYDLQNNISSLGNSVTSTFSWIAATNPNVSGESTTPKTGSIINDVLNNVSNIDELVTYTITPTGANGCLGNLFTVTITVQPEPKGLNDVATINSDIALAYDLQNNVNTLGNGLAASFSWVAASSVNVSGESTTPQAGGFINDILNNITNANQAVIYTVTPTGVNGCVGNTFLITVTVLPEPVGINDAVTVNSDVTVNYNLQTNVNSLGNGLPSTFSWVAAPNPNVTGESAGPQSGPIITDVITNITGVDQVVIYTVTPTGTNGVLGDPFTITVTVRSEPLGADDTKTICSDATVAYDLQNNINTLGNGVASTFTWVAASNTNVSGESTTLQAGSLITDVLNNVTNADQLVFYTVIPTGNNSVVGNPFTITVVVQPEPVIDPALASKTICSRDITNITLNTDGVSVAAANYNISLVSQDAGLTGVPTTGNGLAPNAILNNSFINLTSTPLKVVYQIVPISAVGCVGNPFNITLTVNAEPVVNTALDNTVCSQEISNIILSTNGTSVAASSYQLVSVTVPGTITADGSNAVAGSISSVNLIRNDKYTNNTSGPVIVIYEIVGISPAGCIGQPEFINLTVNPAPIMIPGTANLCSDVPSGIIVGPAAGSATITQFELKNVVKAPALVAGGSNAGLGIYAANLAGGQSDFLSNDTFTNTTNGPLIVTYTVVPIAAGCRGLDQTVVFTVNPAPAVDDNLNRTVCSDGVAGIVFATETSPLSTAAASYNIVTIIVQAGLVRTAGSAAVPRNGVTANDIQADQFRNPTNDPLTVTYGVQAVSGASCLGPIRNIVLTVEPEIIATPVNNAPNICSNDQTDIDLISPTNPTSGVVTFNYTAVSSVGGLISGFVPALNNLPENYKIEDALVNNSDNPATVTYSISAVANGARNGAGCASLPPAVTVVVSVDPKPKLVASPSIQTVCEGVATAVTLNSNTVPSAGNVRFELLSAAASGGVTGMSAVGTLFTPGSSLADILNNPTVTSQTVTYTFQPKVIGGLGCAGDNVVVTITVNPLPTIVASAQPDICSGDFINITLTPDVANTVALWTVSAPGTVTGASNGAGNLIFQTLFNSGNIPETVNYTVTPRVNGCNGTPIVVSVVVNPKPKFVGLPTAVTVCHGGTLNVPLTSTVAGTTFDWVVDDPSGLGVPLTGSGNVINQPLTNTTGSQASLTYTITPTGPGNCPGDQKLIIVTVAPQINALFVNTSSSICKGSSEFLIIQIDGQAPFQLVYNDGTSDITVNNAGNFKVIQVTPTATTTYTIKSIKDALNCSFLPVGQTVTVTVGETDANFSIVGPASSCGPYLATFQYNQVAGTEYTWQWFDGSPDDVFLAATSIPNTTITHTFTNPNPNAAITYKVTLRTQLPAPFPGCFKSTTTNVTVFPSIITNAFPDRTEICSGESIQFFNQSFGATSHRWFYRVQGTATEIDIRTTPTVNYNFVNTSTSNPIIYEVVYQANNGNCPAADVVMPITVYRAITAGFNEGTVPPFIGGNSTVTFTNTSTPIDVTQFRYEWEFGLNSTPATGNGVGPFSVNYSTPGPRDITLKVVNIAAETALLGCESTFTKTINIPLLPLVAAFTADPVRACFPSDITVLTNTSTGDVMDWRVVDSNGRIAATSNAPLPVFRITNPGVYSIFLTTSNSLTGQVANTQQDNFEVFDNPVASFDLRPTTVYVPDTELTTFNFSIGATDYDWDFGDGGNSTDIEPTYVYKVEGAYDVRLIARNDHGQGLVCTDTLIRKVTAKQGGVTKVPNAFTPNPNGPSGGNPGGPGSGGSGSFNDVFLPIVKGAEEFNMQIFDRWGNLIFESNSANVGWDGYNDNGKLMPAGVYVYKLTIRLSDGQRSTQIGDVTMIR
ncbi:MAG: PKD-like domain-containing protein, partial [Cyclobacteriaceae bacterium]